MPDRNTEEIVHQWQKAWSDRDLRQMVDSCAEENVSRPYFLKYLPKDSPVLECGCGLGQWVVYLNRLGYQMEGVEIVPDCVEVCKTHFPGTKIKQGDVRALPYPDNYFGGYISIGVLEHMIEGPESTIREMRRTMKPGGTAIVTVPALNGFMRLWYPVRKLLVGLFRNSAFLRSLAGRAPLPVSENGFGEKMRELESQLQPGFWPCIGTDPEKGPLFVEYKCRKGFIEERLKREGFEIAESVPVFHPYVFNDIFGMIFFREGADLHRPETLRLNAAGTFLKSVFDFISPYFFNYIHLIVARKK